jgi:hypothetical protein
MRSPLKPHPAGKKRCKSAKTDGAGEGPDLLPDPLSERLLRA